MCATSSPPLLAGHRKPPAAPRRLSFLISAALAGPLWATGIEQAYQDPSAAVRGNAFAATADHPSAVHYNPAGLVWQQSPALQSMTLFSRTRIRHNNASGGRQNGYHNSLTGGFFAAYPGLWNDRLAVGLGVTIPHGLGIEWDDDSLLRSIATEGTLIHLLISPAVSVKLTDSLSVGISLNYAHDELELKQGLFVPGDGFQFKGSGDGWGASVGLLWKANEKWSLGLTYRSAIRTDIRGTARTDTLFPTVSSSRERGKTDFDYPQQVVLGAAYRPNDKWLIELNVQWTDWSTQGDFRLELPSGDLVTGFDYKDTVLAGIGARYQINECLDLNFGYLYSTAAAPEKTYSPLVPDAPLHVLSAGLDWRRGQWKYSAGVLYGHREKRSVSGSPVSLAGVSSDGTWRTDGLSLLLGAVYSF